MESSPPHEFSLNDQMPLRCGLAIMGASLNIILSSLAVYVVWGHPRFRTVLRIDFNTLTVGAFVVQAAQSVVRMVSTALLLQHSMTRELCQITGTLDVSFDTMSVVLMVGFFACLMSIRLRPCRCVSRPLPKHFNEVAWASVGACCGVVTGIVVNLRGENLTGANESKTPFGYTIGWCSLGGNPLLYFGTQGIPVVLYFMCSLITFLALRCSWGGGLRIQTLRWSAHWPIYVRLFGITLIMISSFTFTFLVHYFGEHKHKLMSISSMLASLWPASSAFLFCLSEGVFHEMACTQQLFASADEKETLTERDLLRASQSSHVSSEVEVFRQSATEFGLRAPGGGFTSALRTLLGLEVPGHAPVTSIRRLEDSERRLFAASAI